MVNSVLFWNKTPTQSKAEMVTLDSVQRLDRIYQQEIWNHVSEVVRMERSTA